MQYILSFWLILFTIDPVLAETEKLKPFLGAPPEVQFSTAEIIDLDNNKNIYKTLITQNGEQTVIAFLVDAPEQDVWETIKNYPEYKNWIKQVKQSTPYKTEENNIYVQFKINHWLLGKYQYFIKHYFAWPRESWATWALDEDRNSDFLSSVGFWRTYSKTQNTDYKSSHNKEQTYVLYSANILFKKRKSKIIRNRAIKSSLKQASSWVKKYSKK